MLLQTLAAWAIPLRIALALCVLRLVRLEAGHLLAPPVAQMTSGAAYLMKTLGADAHVVWREIAQLSQTMS